MKSKIWSYITVFLSGAILMLIITYKYLAGDDYTVEIKKLRAKKNVGDVIIPIDQSIDKPKRKKRRDR